MTAPRLTRPLVLEAAHRDPDGAGGYVELWETQGTLWAHVIPRTGRETAQPISTLSKTSYRIIVRGAPVGDVQRPLPGQRFRDGSRVFHIQAVTEHDTNGHYLACFATEEVTV